MREIKGRVRAKNERSLPLNGRILVQNFGILSQNSGEDH